MVTYKIFQEVNDKQKAIRKQYGEPIYRLSDISYEDDTVKIDGKSYKINDIVGFIMTNKVCVTNPSSISQWKGFKIKGGNTSKPLLEKISFDEVKSYSRYRGITDSSRYRLSSDYIHQLWGDNLICTDTECDIDNDGNICLVTPYGDVIHIGKVPRTESPAPKATVRLNGDKVVTTYKYFLDNGHHHSDTDVITVDLSTLDYKSEILQNRALLFLKQNLKDTKDCGSFRSNGIKFYRDIKHNTIEIVNTWRKINRFYRPDHEYSICIKLKIENNMFVFDSYKYKDMFQYKVSEETEDISKYGTGLNKNINDIIQELNDNLALVRNTYFK